MRERERRKGKEQGVGRAQGTAWFGGGSRRWRLVLGQGGAGGSRCSGTSKQRRGSMDLIGLARNARRRRASGGGADGLMG